ncbi:thioredoxin domain-containing protein [Longispora sp. K20-0274]|uniref:DsbA family protein n=1 Tax=Longispora sp. K20-0274 TaxID=3088255 RepID=UPI00399BF733
MSRRVDQKTAARVVREQIAAEDRRRRVMWTAIGVVLAVLIAGAIGYGVWQAQQPTKFNVPATATEKQDGMVIPGTTGKAKVEIYLDYQCPACKGVEEAITPMVDQWIKDNKITLIYHPVAILDPASAPNMYSTRSSAAAGCAADGGKLYEFSKQLYARQPAENTGGLPDDDIIAAGGAAGLIDPAFARCVRDGTYKGWAKKLTDDFTKRGLQHTPTLFVNDVEVVADKGKGDTNVVDALKRMVTDVK